MAGHLLAFLTLVRHVAVGTGHTGGAVRTVDPRFIVGMLHLQHGRLGNGVHPVGELALEAGHVHIAVVFIHAVDGFGREAVLPREDRALGGAVAGIVEVVFHMALGAHERTHLAAGELCGVLAHGLQIILERLAVELELHGFGVVAGRAADGIVVRDFRTELVEVLGPEIVAVLLDPLHHLGGLAVPAGGGHPALFTVPVDAVDFEDVVDRIRVAARFTVFVHEGIAEPQVLEVGLGPLLVAFGQRIHVVVLHEVDGALILAHERGFVVAVVAGGLKGKVLAKRRGLVVVGVLQARLVDRGLQFGCGHVVAARGKSQGGAHHRQPDQSVKYSAIHRPPSLC